MASTKWTLDTAHSEIQFKIRHMMISNVTGQFNNFTSEVEAEDDDFTHSKVYFKANVASIDTNNEHRDNHLKGEDFFDVEKYESITFKADTFDATTGNVTGELTIKEVTKPVTLNAEFHGINIDPFGNTKAGFSLNGKINRSDFGLTWNTALETGGVLVSEEVKISAEIQFVKQN